ncbi:YolD-like family protein [Cytobacillus horneckiae]|nr:YolD-like family protein [Cytobacillus horneckiae]MEC1155662.1 YolD-like family protein [Cytobacillus horneckiae]MED2936980.1 YolD-like family protein [Cytobacillus horneckiae]
MALRDRGKVKWQSAFMMPEHLAALKRFENDYYQEKKPMLDQYEIDEIESKIHYAMEFAFKVKLKVWRDRAEEIRGRICRLDGINKMVYVDINESKEKVFFCRCNWN